MTAFITWNANPEIFHAWGFTLRWYSLIMAVAFLVCYYLSTTMVKREGYSVRIQERGTFYFLIGLIIGARLGHCLFYEPAYYLHHPVEVLKIWKGGLASHGAVAGIMGGMYLYARKVRIPWLWFIDKLAVIFILAGAFVRIGNLMNSEVLGLPTALPWGFIFVRRGEDFARHPAQLYESLVYLGLFLWLFLYHRKNWKKIPSGFLSGLSFITVFTARFLLEFLKDPPPSAGGGIPLNTGQILSIPMVLLGAWLVLRKVKAKTMETSE